MKKIPVAGGTALSLFAFLILTGCASAPPHDTLLDEAQSEYDSAIHDAAIRQSAPEQLQKSSDALDRANSLLKKGASRREVDHFAYLAKKRVEIAKEMATSDAIQSKIKTTGAERDKMIIASKQQKIAALQAELNKMKARNTDRGLVLTLGSVLFDTNKSSLKSGARNEVDKLALFLKNEPGRNVMIEGYTDSTGNPAYNRTLSRDRADAVRDALVSEGINPSRIMTRGFGDQYPIATNKTAAGRQRNRRVEVVISDEKGLFKKTR